MGSTEIRLGFDALEPLEPQDTCYNSPAKIFCTCRASFLAWRSPSEASFCRSIYFFISFASWTRTILETEMEERTEIESRYGTVFG